MEDCQNIEKLSQDVLDLIAWCFENHVVGWDLCHAVEIRLDDQFKNLTEGGDGLVVHGGGDSRRYIRHYGDDNWAVVHWQDPTWQDMPHKQMIESAIANHSVNQTGGSDSL